MIKETMGFGETLDEAKENAVKELNASDFDDVQFEIISMPKKKVLGLFGGAKAQVRAFIEVADKKPKKQNTKNRNQENKAKKEKVEKIEKVEKKQEVVEAPKAQEAVEVKAAESEYGDLKDEAEIEASSPAGKAIAYIRTVLSAMGCENITIKVAEKENASLIHINGDDLSIVIGRRGETLDALQYLSSLIANNGGGHYRISLNIGNYRERREETLTNLANRMAAQVLKTGKNRTLEPMNPYERRIIHTAIQKIDGVVSNSFGDGAARRVVISPEGAEVRPPRMNDRRRSSNGRNYSSRPKTQKVVADTTREPKRDSDIPLYGKIN